jgi:hypothetical protein
VRCQRRLRLLPPVGDQQLGNVPAALVQQASRAQVDHGVALQVAEIGIQQLDIGQVAVDLRSGGLGITQGLGVLSL